jgi:phenylalanyl-tRNA synthetase beta chain
MKFSEKWLRTWVNPAISTEELGARLTMAGLEVDAVEPVAPAFHGVVVGHVLTTQPHPDADRLRVCTVDDGSGEILQIVCGAPNVAPGMRVPLARIGAELPGGLKIKRAKLRGVESQGMLCSASELGVGEAGGGLLALPDDAIPGTDVRELLELDDVSIELGLTPNRGDCLGIAGIARELGVLTRVDVAAPAAPEVAPGCEDCLEIALEAPQACPVYLGRVIRNVNPRAQTPLWMRERLRRSGVRSLGPLVDVTNYVLLELGHPLHAFDLSRIKGGIHVRLARAGESLTLLDGKTVALDPDMLVIADDKRALALAGIMGGQDSAVSDDTTSILLESAWFAPAALAGRARRLGLHTDASHRYERGVDPALQRRAMERATQLILDIAGGVAGPVVEARAGDHLPVRQPVTLRRERLRRLLGYDVAAEEVSDILSRLGMRITRQDEAGWEVVPPSFRFDIAIEADLIEEVARVHGYDSIPSAPPRGELRVRAGGGRERRLRELLAARGYHEAITYSFIGAELHARFEPETQPLRLANPISADTAVMRTSLWPGLVQAADYNLKRQQERIRIFELGAKYLAQGSEIQEKQTIAGLALGDVWPEQWGMPARAVDFHDVKADVEALLGLLGVREASFLAEPNHILHPGQSARIADGSGITIGWLGRLHPRIAEELGLDRHPVLFEIDLDAIGAAPRPAFQPLSRFPSVRRDLALVVDQDVSAGDIAACIRAAAGSALQSLTLFDIYQGKGIDSGKKSLAVGLTFQDFSRTLTDAETDLLIQKVLQELRVGFGATLRD